MIEVKFYDEVNDALLRFAVIISKKDGKWVFCNTEIGKLMRFRADTEKKASRY